MQYIVPVRFYVDGQFFVNAQNSQDARRKVLLHCHYQSGIVQANLPEEDVDWEFPVKADKSVKTPIVLSPEKNSCRVIAN
jgi:hypothetical protein